MARWGSSHGKFAALAALGMIAMSAPACLRDLFITLNYDPDKKDRPADAPEQIGPLQLYATLAPGLLTGYDRPPRAGACYQALAADPALPGELYRFGQCLAATRDPPDLGKCKPPPSRWDACVGEAFPFVECSCPDGRPGAPAGAGANPPRACVLTCEVVRGSPGGSGNSGPRARALPKACVADDEQKGMTLDDEARVLFALATAGEALTAFELSTRGGSLSDPLPPERVDLTREIFRRLGAQLACDGSNPNDACDRQTDKIDPDRNSPAPVLALSGGAANGAFLAGYVFEMLLARTAAKAAPDEDRIDALVGTSVGALIAQVTDLYFADDPVSAEATRWCEEATRDPGTNEMASRWLSGVGPAQQCSLRMLHHYFTAVNEWDLLCAQDGDLVDYAKGPVTSLGRFDPLRKNIVLPFAKHFGPALVGNRTVRVTMTADVQSSTLIGADERACRLPGARDSAARCLASGVMSSIPNPVFAEAERLVWTGLDDRGSLGSWLDGGLRSGAPALRATLLGRQSAASDAPVKVLVISAERSEGNPRGSAAPSSGLEALVSTLGALVQQGHHWEIATAGLVEEQRRRRGRIFFDATFGECVEGTVVSSPTAALGASFVVFTPRNMEPERLTAGGYQFDPLTMKGLFLWGQRTFLDQAVDPVRNVLKHIDWTKTSTGAKAHVEQRRAEWTKDFDAWKSGFPADDEAWRKHVEERKSLMEEHFQKCSGAAP